MNKLLIICGPTSTGKTTLAINLAKKLKASGPGASGPAGEIVSADSRQVYRGMNIGTGKELPEGAKIKYPWFYKWGYYELEGIKVWGYDLVDPKNEFSVAQYLKFANSVIPDIQKGKKLPILVGGTGLYIKGVTEGIPTAAIPKNKQLRKNLETKTPAELYEVLAQLDAIRAGGMNSSDRKNPRRLIRAIEISQYLIDHKNIASRQVKEKDLDVLFIGLTADRNYLEKAIELRAKKRLKAGIKKEVEELIKKKIDWNSQPMVALGYRQWRDYFEKKASEQSAVDKWINEEKKYAKRQMTWFKKIKSINWFNITEPKWREKVEFMVKKWYSSDTNA
jgi:tRNA dimethylallyltransferase